MWLHVPYRALQAEAQAQRAERIAKDTLHKLETALSRIGKGVSPLTGDLQLTSLAASDPASAVSHSEKTGTKQPFWVIPHSSLTFTPKELGRGRWGVVKVAEYKRESVAARCLYTHFPSEESRKLFMESMELAAKLRHPNILPLLGVVMEGEQPILVMELMPRNLRRVMDGGKLYNNQIATLAMDVAAGLHFLHTTQPEPVVHGDIPTTGILVQKEAGNCWRAKLSDFMTAKYYHDLIMSGHANDMDSGSPLSFSSSFERGALYSPTRSTPRTTPPPFARGKMGGSDASINKHVSNRKQTMTPPDMYETAALTPQRDIYCFGFVLVEICTGTPPLDVSLQFLTESITWSDMSSIVKLCTEHQPSNRPSIETVLNKLKYIHRTVTSRPSKFNMTLAS
jgi:serine/threonine protein kinase